tara:strand:- start:642 stop:974 length:333 start_codon:yes stop_codon:yes gene_type:complete
MDTSEQYIKMCEKAVKIQKLRPSGADEHDYFWCPVHGLGCDLDNAIWLPTQSELQAVLRVRKPVELAYRLSIWALFEGKKFNSMEQLWLAFVMRKRFGKIWSKTEWIDAK